MKKIAALLITLATLLSLTAGCSKKDPIQEEGWAPDVKAALNDFIRTYGNKEDGGNYVVFDFDNTCCIYDVSEQFIAYQLENMCFALEPEAFAKAVTVGLDDCRELTQARTDRAAELYASLYAAYGPFTPAGLDDASKARMLEDGLWKEFADLMGGTYHHLIRHHAIENPYMWAMGWFAGMTQQELYDAFVRSDLYYEEMETAERSWGEYTWTDGLKVTENIRELWKALDEAGIDVWVCSASSLEAVLASIDAYGLHDYCTGAIGMTLSRDAEGRFDGGYDYETGYAYFACHDCECGGEGGCGDCKCGDCECGGEGCGKDEGECCGGCGGEGGCCSEGVKGWHRGNLTVGVQTKQSGKVTAIENCIMPLYEGRGPLACFMDSSGDFNFCTEFASLKMVVCFNRAELDVNDGGALIAETALYQRDELGYDLAKANAASDVLYLLQGRDVNGTRSLCPSNGTLLLGAKEAQLFYSSHSDEMLKYFIDNNLTTKQILETFCIRKEAGEEGNPFPWRYGWLKEYDGYRSK